jgi:hypothetical protein
VNNNQGTDNNQKSAGFRLPTQIVFGLSIFAFGIISAFNPLGAAGLPLSIIAAAMLVTIALSFKSNYMKVSAFFSLELLSFIVSAAIYVSYGKAGIDIALINSLAALYPVFLAFPIYIGVRLKKGRSFSIAAAGLATTLFWILYTALSIYFEYGTINLAVINTVFDESFSQIKNSLEAITYEKNGEILKFYNSSDIELLIYNIKTLLIGSLAAIMMTVAYFVTLVSRFIAISFDQKDLFPVGYRYRFRRVIGENGPLVEMIRETVQWRIELDSITAIIFIASYLVTVLFDTSGGKVLPLAITAKNLIIILLPGFLYAGGRDLLTGITGKNPAGGRGCLLFVLAGFLMIISPMMLFMLLSVIGVISTLRENKRRSDANKNRKE